MAQAHWLSATPTDYESVSGSAATSDSYVLYPGFPYPRIHDFFSVAVGADLEVRMFLAADDTSANDLDLYLFDRTGNLQDLSVSTSGIESISIPASIGTRAYIGVGAYEGRSGYCILVSSATVLTSLDDTGVPFGAEFIPGAIIVKEKGAEGVEVVRAGLEEKPLKLMGKHRLDYGKKVGPDAHLLRVDGAMEESRRHPKWRRLGREPGENEFRALTLEKIRQLRKDPGVEYAEPDYILHTMAVPNDPYFGLQWHYNQINLPRAWDLSTGRGAVVIAVLDSGAINHPDLAGRWFTWGYDFVSNPTLGMDSDGIDPDPTDSAEVYHGTHVAGTIGAATNNGVGVAGVTWQGRLMPVRVAGAGGVVVTSDLVSGIRYSARLSNDSGTMPGRKANVINMSLGMKTYSQSIQDAVTAARGQGCVVVGSAGNSNVNAPFYPASCSGVISVSACNILGNKASYSNYGPMIDVTAPGGEPSDFDWNYDGYRDGVLSTYSWAGLTNYYFNAGTSMAAPHVSGVAALMLSANPALTPNDIDMLLAGTHPLTTYRITRDLGLPGRDDFYGHGLIDAYSAVAVAQILASLTPPQVSVLSLSASALDFGQTSTTLPVFVSNPGQVALQVTGVSGAPSWLTVSPTSGTAPFRVNLTVNRAALSVGTHTATITIQSNATSGPTSAQVQVRVEKVASVVSGNVGPVRVFLLDGETFDIVTRADTTFTFGYSFLLDQVPAGTYLLLAATDRDGDNLWWESEEDAFGFFPDFIQLGAGGTLAGADFTVDNLWGFSDDMASSAGLNALGGIQ